MNTPKKQPRRWFRRKRILIPASFVALIIAAFWMTRPEPVPFRGSGERMKAIIYDEYGTADVLKYTDIEKPLPNDNQVLIKVRAAATNPLDWHYMRGTPYILRWFAGVLRPYDNRIGADVAGVVVAVGAKVTQFKVGDEVYGSVSDGSFAEYARAREARIVHKPSTITFEQAAAVPVAAMTALQTLRDHGELKPGQKVLIVGASGGVGTFAVQIAKALGAEVTGVCSTRNVDLVKSLGADYVIDYTQQDYTKGAERYDLVMDNVKGSGVRANTHVMSDTGIYVGVGGGGPDAGNWIGPFQGSIERLFLAPFVSQKLTGMLAEVTQKDLLVMNELMEGKKVTPVIDRTYPLSQTADAIRYLETGRARGKVVIVVDPVQTP